MIQNTTFPNGSPLEQAANNSTSLARPIDYAVLEKDARINLRRKVSAPPFIVRIDGIGALPKKDIFAIKAKSKMGKTQAASILMAGVLGDESLGITIAEPYKTRVAYFDTEQADYNTILVGHRVHRLLGWVEESNNTRFRIYNLREWDWSDKLPFIEHVISTFRPTLAVIDGIADLLLDFNNAENSALCILKLMQIASKFGCSLGCVLHENKKKDDDGMKGHLGTLLLQKASDVFKVEKKNGIFTMSQTETRNKPVGDISWLIDDDGFVIRKDKEPQQVKAEVKAAKSAIWRQVFAGLNVSAMPHKDLVNEYKSLAKCSDSTAKRKIKEALEEGLLAVGEDKLYALV